MANITYRHSIPSINDIPVSNVVKEEPLSLEEIDINFRSLDNGIAQTVVLAGGIPATIRNTVNVFSKNQSVAPVNAVLSSGNVIIDASLSNNFKITLNNNYYMPKPTNLTDGMILNFYIKQNGVGGPWNINYASQFLFVDGVPPTHSANPDYMTCYYDATDDVLVCNLLQNFTGGV